MQSKAQTSIRSRPTLFLFCMLSLGFIVSLVVDMGALLIHLFPESTFWAPASSGNSSGTIGAFGYVIIIHIVFGYFYYSGFGLVFLLIFIASVIMTWNWFRQVSESIRALNAGAVGLQGRAAGNDNAVDRSCLMKLTHALGDLWSKSLPKTLPDGAALENGSRAPRVVRALPLILVVAFPSLLGNLYSWLASWVDIALPMFTNLVQPLGFARFIDIWLNSPLIQISVGLLVVSDVALILACVYMISFIKRVTANLETRLSDERKAARETNG